MADELPETILEKAAASGDVSALKELVGGGDCVFALSEEASVALCIAAEQGHWDAVQYLVTGAGVHVSSDDSGGTVLQLAAVAGRLDAMEMLIAAGANICSARVAPRVLLSSAATGKLDILRFAICQRIDVATYGYAAAQSAAKSAHWDSVEILIDAGANLTEQGLGAQLMAHAAAQNQVAVLALLQTRGVAIDSDAGVLALSTLASTQEWDLCADAVRYLVSEGVNTRSEAGTKTFVIAAICGDLELVKNLVESGVDLESGPAQEAMARAGELGAPDSSAAIVEYLKGLGMPEPEMPKLGLDEDF
uniref:Ankyrin-like protein n=1 Tax=Karlodinium veneficum TaxID=407301 RepID=A7YXX7_KARVE|nr:ankyrin-like protein [Karlodinium veneficum]